MTRPHDDGDDPSAHRHDGPVLGEETAPADDAASGGAEPGPASGAAGPSWPPAGTEPDAR